MKMTIDNVNENVNVYIAICASDEESAVRELRERAYLHDDEFVLIHVEGPHDDDEAPVYLFACHADVADVDLYEDTMHDHFNLTQFVNAPYEYH